MSLLGAIGAVGSAAALSSLSSSLSNKANKKLQNQAFAQSLYTSNTAHQREVEDLKAAGLNPVLSANSGAAAPTATASEYQSPISSALDRAIQTAYAREELTALHEQNKGMREQNKALKFENDFYDEYGSYLKANRMTIDNAQTATALAAERSASLEGDILQADRDFMHNTYQQRKELLDYQHTLTKHHVDRDTDLRNWELLHPDLANAGRTYEAIKPMVDTGLDVANMWLNRRSSARSAAIAERNAENATQRLMFDVRKYEEGKRSRGYRRR